MVILRTKSNHKKKVESEKKRNVEIETTSMIKGI